MVADNNKGKGKGRGGKLTKLALGIFVIGIIGLVGLYYLRTGAFPFAGGELGEFLKFQWLW